MRASAYRLRDKMLPNAQKASIYVVPQDMTIWKIAASIYGNAAKASLLTSANAILNPLKVPAGQRLLVPPK
jgi:nucleoid-associated protein YgaU